MAANNGIQKTHTTDLTKSTTDSKINELGKIIKHVNQLTPFTLSVEQIEEWCKSLIYLYPDLDQGALMFLINEMKKGNYEYDRTLGIQNITKGLARIKHNKNGYYLNYSENHY